MEKEILYLIAINIPIFILSLYIGCNIGRFKSQGIIYGVRVPNKYIEDKRIKYITDKNKKEMFLALVSYWLISTIICFWLQSLISVVIQILLLQLIFILIYGRGNNEMLKLKEEIKWMNEFKGKIFIDLKSKNKEVKPEKMETKYFITALVIGVLCILITALKYNSLPELVAVHFAFDGTPDRYTNTRTVLGAFELFMIPLIGVGITAIFYFTTKYDFKKRELKNLNGGTYSQIKNRDKITGKALNDLNGRVSILTAILFCVVDFFILGIIPQNSRNNSILIGFTFVFVLIITGLSFRAISDTNKEYIGILNEKEYYRDDDEFYKLGLFYFNKEDPSILKEKRIGIGYDFNYGNIKGEIIISLCFIWLIASIIIIIIKY